MCFLRMERILDFLVIFVIDLFCCYDLSIRFEFLVDFCYMLIDVGFLYFINYCFFDVINVIIDILL